MRRILYIGVLMTVACSHPPAQQTIDSLVLAENLLFAAPDSARVVLKSVDTGDLHDGPERAKYLLLSTVADDLTGVAHSSAHDILDARSYYIRSSAPDSLLAVVHFHAGRVFADTGRPGNALRSFLDAEKCLDRAPGDTHFWRGRVNYQIAAIYYEGAEYRKSLHYAERAVMNFTGCRDSVNLAHSHKLVGRNLLLHKEYERAVASLAEAERLYIAGHDTQGLMSTVLIMSGVLLKMPGGADKADELLTRTYRDHNGGVVPPKHFPMFNRVRAAKSDSPEVIDELEGYLEQSGPTLLMRISISDFLSEHYAGLEQYRQAYDNLQRNNLLRDSMYRPKLNDSLAAIESRHESMVLHDAHVRDVARLKKQYILGSILVLSVAAAITVERRRKVRTLKADLSSLNKRLGEFDLLKKNMDEVLDEKNAQETRLGEVLLHRVYRIQKIANYLYLYENNPAEFIRKVRNAIIVAERDDYFGTLHEVVNRKYAGIVDYLTQRFPTLTESELNLCCLICFGFNNNQIGILFGHTNSGSIFTNRHKLRKKLALWPNYDSLEGYLLKLVEDLKTGTIGVQSTR